MLYVCGYFLAVIATKMSMSLSVVLICNQLASAVACVGSSDTSSKPGKDSELGQETGPVLSC